MTPAQLLNKLRLERAKLHLEQSSKPISSIAADVGFNQPASFTRAFSKQYGISPSSYRKRFK